MKSKFSLSVSLAATVAAGLLFCASCKKKDATDNSGPTDTDAAYASDQVQLKKHLKMWKALPIRPPWMAT
ncbi:MAG: hypothetical protein QM743_02295 [Chitinophagaceae bacterium]